MTPDISIVIPAYCAAGTIDSCLQALATQSVPRRRYEILVVDDGSTDGTVERVRAWPDVQLLMQAHGGPAAARNLGVAQAQGEVVLFTDADCAPAEDWIERMTAPFHLEPDRSRSTGPVAASNHRVVGSKGVYLTRQRELVARFVQLEYEDKYERMARQETIDFIDTYSAAYRRDTLLENGGFDIAFPEASVEDQEFSFRLARKGYRMVFVPEARVYHWGHARNLAEYWQKKFKIGYWKVLVHRRHPDKLVRDSHTPPSLKLQILLVALGGVCAIGGIFWTPLAWTACLFGLLFLVTALPFVRKAWRRDPWVAVSSPGLLLIRALALGSGFAMGLVAHTFSRQGVDNSCGR
ncbi:MAG: glycosyltransferase [Anaerolineae bacterium]|nr:glycosyltransferase [Anaerolineae bacterium]